MNQSINKNNSQWFLNGFPVLGEPDEARAVKYFSLNPFVPNHQNRCPLECAYCICHQDADWHQHPEKFKSLTMSDDALITQLLDIILNSDEGKAGYPISLCDYSDPFIATHQPRILSILQKLIDCGANNMVYITTKYHPGVSFLNNLKILLTQKNNLKVTIFVSLPPLQKGYEKVSVASRIKLIKDLVDRNLPCCWYLRPLTEEWFDEALLRDLAETLVPVIKDNIIMSDEIESLLKQSDLIVPDWQEAGVKKPLDADFEQRIRAILNQAAMQNNVELGPVMGHRLCGTNGNHAYGCLICGKNSRYCQMYQHHHYGVTIDAINNQSLKIAARKKQKN